MDGQSRDDVERRLIETESVVERCMCDKTGKKKAMIRGYAALFNSDSQDLGGFVERISPGAFDGVMKRGTDVVALYNHDPMFILGRESAGTLRLFIDEKGLRYEVDAPESRADVIEAIERGDVRGSSFAFRVKGSGENWSRDQQGRQIREIREIDGLFDVGPVLKPAYSATESFVSRRALEHAAEVREEKPTGLKPTSGMAAAAKKGLRLHEEGKSGDGLKPETVARARKIARRERLTEDHVVEMAAWFKRHAVDKKAGWDKAGEETPGYVAYLLWGGRAGENWSNRKSASMKRELPEAPAETRAEDEMPDAEEEQMQDEPNAGSLSANNYDLYEALEQIVGENGQWPQDGADGAHYMPESPFAKSGMQCSNCVFWNAGGSCDVVEGEIAEAGVCKLWIIPNEKLSMDDPAPQPEESKKEPPQARSIDADAAAARLKAKSLESAANVATR